MPSAHAGACLLRVGHVRKGTVLKFIWRSFWTKKGTKSPTILLLGPPGALLGDILQRQKMIEKCVRKLPRGRCGSCERQGGQPLGILQFHGPRAHWAHQDLGALHYVLGGTVADIYIYIITPTCG